nr:putative leucine-rich repeat-containing protein DDB_G0290503 [Cherax quadricarinatus]
MNSEKKPRGRGGQKTPGNKTHSQSVRQPRKAEPSDQNSHSDNHKNSAIKDAPCQVASCDNNVKQASVGCIPKQVSDLEGDNQKQCDIMDTNIQIKSQIPNSSNRNMTEQDFYANSLQNIETAPQTLNQMDEQASGGCIPKQVSDLECDNQKQCDVMDTNIQIKSQIPNSSNRNMTEQDFYANTNLQNIETAPQTWNKMESYEETEIQNICLPDNRPNGYMHIDSNCRTLIDSYQEKPQFLPAKKGEHRFEKENEQFDAEEIELVDAKMNKGSDTEDDGNSNAKLSDSFDATPNRNESFSTEPKKQLSKETKDNGKIHIEGIENMEDKEYDHKNVNFQIMPNKCSDSCSLNSSDGKQNEEFKSKQHEKHDINEDTFFNKEKHDYDSKSLEDKNEKLAEENVKPVVIQNECSGAEQNDKQSKGNVELDLQNECPEARLNEKHSREDELDVMQNECTQIKEREKHLKNEYSKSKQNVKSVEETEDYDSMQNENVHPGVKHVGSEAKPDGKHSEEHHRPEVMQNEYPKPKLNEKYAQKYEKLDDMKDETEVKPHEQLGARRKVEQNIVHVKENKEHDSVQREYCKTIQEEHMKENEEPYLGQNKCLEKKQTDRLVKENEMPNAVQINAGHHECFTTKQIKLLDKEDENNGLQYPDTEGEDQVEDELRKEDTCNDEHEKENKKVVTQNKKSYDERPNNQLHNKPGEMLLNAIVNVTAGQSEQVGVIENIQFDDRESDQLKENEHILKSKELHAELSKKANLKKCEVDSNDVCKFSSKLNEEQMVKISEEQNPNGKESELLSIKPNEEYICVSQGRPSERQMKNDDRSMQKLNDRSVQELNDMSVQKNYSTPVQNLHHVEKKLNNQNEDKEFNNQEQDNKQNSFQDVKKFQGQQNIYQEKQNLDTYQIIKKSISVPVGHSDNISKEKQ